MALIAHNDANCKKQTPHITCLTWDNVQDLLFCISRRANSGPWGSVKYQGRDKHSLGVDVGALTDS